MLTVTFLGHACFLFSDGEHSVVVDPFLTGNPAARRGASDVCCDYVVLTHGHADHIADAVPIAQRNNAVLCAPYELASYMKAQGVEKTEPANPGGKIPAPFGFVAFTRAHHSSSAEDENGHSQYLGVACGVVLRIGGKTVYHAGDTDFFSDMKFIGEFYRPDLAILPIGDRFTMGPELASRAAEIINAPLAIPCHYNTMPQIAQDPSSFKPKGVEVKILRPEDALTLE